MRKQVYSNGKDRNLDLGFEVPYNNDLKISLADGSSVPFVMYKRNAVRFTKDIPEGDVFLDIEESMPTVKPVKLDNIGLSLIRQKDIDRLNRFSQELGIKEEIIRRKEIDINALAETIKALETQNSQKIDENLISVQQSLQELYGVINSLDEQGKARDVSLNDLVVSLNNAIQNALQTHIEDFNNPHNVKKEQIGLGNVDNTADIDKPISKAVKKALDEKLDKKEAESIREEIKKSQKTVEKIHTGLANMTGGLAQLELPRGGKEDQLLAKASNKDGHFKWIDSPIIKHNDTLNRDDADCHPISAITSLQDELDLKLPTSTKYGSSLSLTIDSTTFIMTAQLKDQDGNNLGTAQTIDLPMESVVVSGYYDSDTKEVVLTLQSGSTIRFSVADLVAGLQSEITVDNKLSADLVDDSTSTNKFVTAGDISNWNGKYDASNPDNFQENVIETVKVNGSALTPSGKAVDITVPTDTSDLTNGAGFITGINSTDVTNALGYTPYNSTNPSGYQANVLEGVQVNGTDLTISSKKVNVPVPTTVAELSDASDYALVSSLSTVATSGSYTDLLNKPTIPTVNNATLTIQKNGTTVDTFTANSSTNTTVNITVPTQASDISALPDSTKADDIGGADKDLSNLSATGQAVIDAKANDSDVVKLTGNQSIAGNKAFTGVLRVSNNTQDTSVYMTDTGLATNNTTPSANRIRAFRAFANDGSIVGDTTFYNYTDGTTTAKLRARRTISGTNKDCVITCNVDSNGDVYTSAPTPASGDNSTKIATTAWVKGCGFITGISSGDVTTALGFTPADSSSLATVATSGQYSDLTGTPTIPTVNNSTITITQGGVTKGSFTLNQSSGDTIALDAGGGSSLPSQTGQAGKFLTTDGTDASWAVPNSHNLFDFKWTDYELADQSWLRADTYSWQDGTVYSDAYNHLVADYNSGTSQTETIGSYTITYVLASDGHKITTDETTVSNIYSETGVAWYYVLDTTNQRFKLPRTKHGFTGYRDAVGKYVAPTLPNITGELNTSYGNAGGTFLSAVGAFSGTTTTKRFNRTADSNNGYSIIKFDASYSSSIYKNGATVQSHATQMYLYFYVGQFSQTATEQTAGLNSSLFNGKVDLDASNLNATGKSNISGFGMPSDEYVNLTLGASGTTYTAPRNGWFVINKQTGGSNQYVNFVNNTNGMTMAGSFSSSGGFVRAFIPVKNRDVVVCNYNASGNLQYFRFVYADGEV